MPAKMGDYQDPEEKKIEDKRKALKIPTPDDFKTKASRDALYNLNMKNAKANESKDDTAADTAAKAEKERKAKPFVFKKGGMVKKGGIARVHSGERVLTKSQQKKVAGSKCSLKR